jgi:hypothetical protein
MRDEENISAIFSNLLEKARFYKAKELSFSETKLFRHRILFLV